MRSPPHLCLPDVLQIPCVSLFLSPWASSRASPCTIHTPPTQNKGYTCSTWSIRANKILLNTWMDGWMNQGYSRLSTTHSHHRLQVVGVLPKLCELWYITISHDISALHIYQARIYPVIPLYITRYIRAWYRYTSRLLHLADNIIWGWIKTLHVLSGRPNVVG